MNAIFSADNVTLVSDSSENVTDESFKVDVLSCVEKSGDDRNDSVFNLLAYDDSCDNHYFIWLKC